MSRIDFDFRYDNGDVWALVGDAADLREMDLCDRSRRELNVQLMKVGLPWVLVNASGERAEYDEQQKVIASLTAERDALKEHNNKLANDIRGLVAEVEAAEEALRRLREASRELLDATVSWDDDTVVGRARVGIAAALTASTKAEGAGEGTSDG